ncbi:MAG: site-specific DNA-methyltransferase, partial [Ignavibacteriaceae bacterium]|nr:site-specific DNA-methyltransferase [Ignavibacteriaceae bacterium]
MKKKRAPYNRTITLSAAELEKFKHLHITPSKNVNVDDINNQIIKGDFFKVIDLLPDKFVDLLFIDPPYNLSKKFNDTKFKAMKLSEYEVYVDSWLSKLVRLLKPDASIYICGDWKSSNVLFTAASKYFVVQNRITWERDKGRGSKNNWKNNTEDIWFCTMTDKYTFNLDDVKIKRKVLAPYKDENGKPKDWENSSGENFRATHPSNIWNDITVPFWSMPENTDHPTQKPEKLLAKIILASSKKGDMIFDPFLGSGTTAVAAKKLNRNFCGIE